jgi:branched-chain amino acid transport system ATP-binding protein
MGIEDIERTAALIRLAGTRRTIVMVEHNLSVVASLADRITVLSRGSIIAEGNYDAISKNPDVINAYIGGGDD